MSIKIISKNKRAYFDYEILEEFEAGIALAGAEVKSVKNSQVNLADSFVRFEGDQAYLWNANIAMYKHAYDPSYDPLRSRKLLLKKGEIDMLQSKVKQARLTVVPLKVYLSRGLVKLSIGLVRGKKQYEKKLKIKERDLDRELHREKRVHMVK